MLRNHFGYKYHLYSHLLFWKMTCKIIFHFQAMRVLLFLNHEQRYEIACRWLRTSLLPKNKSFCSVRNPFGKWKLWQLYIEREIMQTYLQISFLNPITFDPFGTICHISGLMQKSHWYFAPFVKAWKGANKYFWTRCMVQWMR